MVVISVTVIVVVVVIILIVIVLIVIIVTLAKTNIDQGSLASARLQVLSYGPRVVLIAVLDIATRTRKKT